MSTITKFEDLEVWQLARQLNIKIYPLLQSLNEKRNSELKNQLDSSACSVMDNISEGFERDGNREFIQFLAISKGSLGEVLSQLYRVFNRNMLDKEAFENLQNDCLFLAGKIAKFITYLRNTEFKGNKFKKD
ncbi:MAG: four helix bundle protein [Bacteroidia bacterium]|nr:four helix bundle protein [Bacteroidia bacterium]